MSNGSIITNKGWDIILNRAYKAAPDYTIPTKVRFGVDSDTPTVSQTSLDHQVPIAGTEALDTCEATTGWTASGTNSVTLNTSSVKEGSGSLNIVKTDATSATASVSKTTTSRDFTSKDFWMWVYVSDALYAKLAATGCVEVLFGSDASNYYRKTYDKTGIIAGWNYLTFNTATASGVTGTPVIAACDYTLVKYVTANAADTAAAGDFIFDDIKLASSDDYTKAMEDGYPSVDESADEVTHRVRLLTTEANGYAIDCIAWFNTDGSPVMHSIDVITEESKASTDEFIFEAVDRRAN